MDMNWADIVGERPVEVEKERKLNRLIFPTAFAFRWEM
jgi:hypothetical protein